jgi:hypothetical protein
MMFLSLSLFPLQRTSWLSQVELVVLDRVVVEVQEVIAHLSEHQVVGQFC